MGIYVWGTGCGASELLEQGFELDRVEAFVDSFPMGDNFLEKPVLLPDQLPLHDCDLLIITARHADAIGNRCRELGIPEEKCLFLKNNMVLTDRNTACTCAKDILGEDLLKKLLPKHRIVPTPAQLAGSALPERDLGNDYVRLATLELLCRRLAEVPGAAAELGVYRGFFARCINQLLPERKLYLFDSFEGFAQEDCASAAFQAAHRNTAIDKVLSIMPHPEQIVLHQGYFPDSLNGLETKFALVSLDPDLYAPTLAGLRYFYPRMNPGGVILIHDYNNRQFTGVKKAVSEYEAEHGRLLLIPLVDLHGTAAIIHP